MSIPAGEGQHVTLVDSPNGARPDDPLTREISRLLAAIERNYASEGSGPGSRFEGRLLEDVQAAAILRRLREREAFPGG